MQKTAILMLAMLVTGLSAWADSTLHIGPGAGTSCAEGCAGEPNLIGSGVDSDVFQESGGGKNGLTQPLLLIIGVPNDSTNMFVTDPIISDTFTNPYPGGTMASGTSAFASAGTDGLKSPVIDGFFGDMGPGSAIYSFLTLQGPTNNSNSFTNWSAADLSIDGITASNFGIYVFALSGADLGPKGLDDIMIPGGLPLGTFVVGYGENSNGKVFDTPFTEAGLTAATTAVTPEPASLLLFASGLLAFAATLGRRKSRPWLDRN